MHSQTIPDTPRQAADSLSVTASDSCDRQPATVTVTSGLRRLLLLAAGVLALRAAIAASLPLLYDEAYFWEWSRFPAPGYYDHPPLVAWIIALTTQVIPARSELAVRLGALVCGVLSLGLIHSLALRLFREPRVAWRAVLFAACVPVLHGLGILMTPDAPALLFHLLFLNLFWIALAERAPWAWALAGVALGLALLSKLAALLTLACAVGYLAASARHRAWLRRPHPYGALALALLVFLPCLAWNSAYGWPNFAHELFARHDWHAVPQPRLLLEAAFEQAVNASPFLLVPLLGVLCLRSGRWPEPWRPAVLFLQLHSLPVLGFFLAAGSVIQTHPHWTAFAYPPACIALAALCHVHSDHFLARRAPRLALVNGVILGCVAVGILAGRPLLARLNPRGLPPYAATRIRKAQRAVVDWRGIAQRLPAATPGAPRPLWFTDHRDQAVMLGFYGRQGSVIALSARPGGGGQAGRAQRYYLPDAALANRGGYYVSDAATEETEERLNGAFQFWRLQDPVEMRHGDQVVRRLALYQVDGFQPLERDR